MSHGSEHKWRGTDIHGTNVWHEYIMQIEDLELVKRIKESKAREQWKGKVYQILEEDGYKYWLIYPVINRRKLPEPKEVGAERLS
jgi:hypothetical protein